MSDSSPSASTPIGPWLLPFICEAAVINNYTGRIVWHWFLHTIVTGLRHHWGFRRGFVGLLGELPGSRPARLIQDGAEGGLHPLPGGGRSRESPGLAKRMWGDGGVAGRHWLARSSACWKIQKMFGFFFLFLFFPIVFVLYRKRSSLEQAAKTPIS